MMSPMLSPAMLVAPLALALLAGSGAPAAPDPAGDAAVGPPWISIEYPANPLDRTTRGAYLLVHAFHHGTPVGLPVRGTAEGIVDGRRRTVTLEFTSTSRPGVYALTRQWPAEGRWLLAITVTQGGHDSGATALVRLAPEGGIASVEVPSRQEGGWTIPLAVSRHDIESALARHAATPATGEVARRP
jgi:hypothetical protein